ncbi:MAG: DUF2017 family protein [bacterium]
MTTIKLLPDGSARFDHVGDDLYQILCAIREPVESGNPLVESRMFPQPSEDSGEDDLLDDWKSLVEPELHDAFLAARESVAADLRGAQWNADGSRHFIIPRSHMDNWLSALNQARLALAEIHQFTDEDLSRSPGDLEDPTEFALMRMSLYGSIQEWIVAITS